MSRKLSRRGRTERFIWLRFWLMDSPAWCSLPCNARALYVELARRYNGHNNGRISYGVRQAARRLHIGNTAARQAFWFLQDRGFIVCTKKGAFSLKAVRDASEWRLTEYASDFPPAHATKDFMSWRPSEPQSNEPAKSRTRCLRQARTVSQASPYGVSGKPVDSKKGLHGVSGEPVSAEKDPSTVSEASHIQLPGAARARAGGERSAPEGSAVASEPPDWHQLGYPPGSPSHAEVLVTLEPQAQERGRARPLRQAGRRSR
jgi:hypothetical protein